MPPCHTYLGCVLRCVLREERSTPPYTVPLAWLGCAAKTARVRVLVLALHVGGRLRAYLLMCCWSRRAAASRSAKRYCATIYSRPTPWWVMRNAVDFEEMKV
eukprot:923914-Prymnesium_polylepis.1